MAALTGADHHLALSVLAVAAGILAVGGLFAGGIKDRETFSDGGYRRSSPVTAEHRPSRPPPCVHEPVAVESVVTGETLGWVCAACLDVVDAPGRGGVA